jgi:hypothetical protein
MYGPQTLWAAFLAAPSRVDVTDNSAFQGAEGRAYYAVVDANEHVDLLHEIVVDFRADEIHADVMVDGDLWQILRWAVQR